MNTLNATPPPTSNYQVMIAHPQASNSSLSYANNGVPLPITQTALQNEWAVILIEGVINKFNSTDIVTRLDVAANSPALRGVILLIDSPGGEAKAGLQIIEALRRCPHPTAAYIYGDALSMGYWIASQVRGPIVAQGPYTQVGSVGAYIEFFDVIPALKKQGVEVHTIYSSYSTEKNLPLRKALQGDYDSLRTTVLDPMVELFIHDVTQGRALEADTVTEVLKGGAFNADKGVELGLVDTVGNFQTLTLLFNQFINTQNNRTMNTQEPKNQVPQGVTPQATGIPPVTPHAEDNEPTQETQDSVELQLKTLQDGISLVVKLLQEHDTRLKALEKGSSEEAPAGEAKEDTQDPSASEMELIKGQLAALQKMYISLAGSGAGQLPRLYEAPTTQENSIESLTEQLKEMNQDNPQQALEALRAFYKADKE